MTPKLREARDLTFSAQERGERPRVHPNGFIKLTLEPGLHLHVWPDGDDIPRQSVRTTIHDHRFGMDSTVVKGTLVQLEYPVVLCYGEGRPTHQIYRQADLDEPDFSLVHKPGSDTVLRPSGILVVVGDPTETIVEVGDSYEQPPTTFHDTVWSGLTATLMEKTSDITHQPRVLVPVGREPENSFRRYDADDALLWAYIERALA